MNLFRWLLARVHLHVTITPAPTSRGALMLAALEPEPPAPILLQTATGSEKPKRKRKAKVITQSVLFTEKQKIMQSALLNAAPEPEPPTEDAWLRRLRERKRPRPSNDPQMERLPETTSSAKVRDLVIRRELGESISGFYDRVRAQVGDSLIDWGTDEPEKTKLNIVQDHLNRPLRATEDADFSGVLPEDLTNYIPDHRVIH
jgi:hypothetical protein